MRKTFACLRELFWPLEIRYDYAGIKKSLSREKIAARERNLWRYRELFADRRRNRASVCIRALRRWCAPIVSARRSASNELYVKDDSVNHPTFSYKDRVVSVAISKRLNLVSTPLLLRVDR